MPPGIRKDEMQGGKEKHCSIFSDAPSPEERERMRKASSVTTSERKVSAHRAGC